jgi:hypothetical protein
MIADLEIKWSLLWMLSFLITDIYKLNPQNCWAFGLCPSFGVLETKEHNILEI